MSARAPRTHGVCNQRILTDDHTPFELLIDTFFADLIRTRHICLKAGCRCDISPIPRAGWRFTPRSLATIKDDKNPITSALVPFLGSLPELRDLEDYDDYEVNGVYNPDRKQMAEQAANAKLVAESLVQKEGAYILNPYDKLVPGELNAPLVFVHERSADEPGFVPITLGIYEEQERCRLPRVEIYTHQGTRGTIQPFPVLHGFG